MAATVVALAALLFGLVLGFVVATRFLKGTEETRRRAAQADADTALALTRQEAAAIPGLKVRIESLETELRTAGGFASRCDEQERTIRTLEDARVRLEGELVTAKTEAASATAARQGAETAIETLRRDKDAQLAERDGFITKLETRITEVMGRAAGEVVQRAQEDFSRNSERIAKDDLEKRQKGIDELISPLRHQLKGLEELSERIQAERAGQSALIGDGIRTLQTETKRLSDALRKPQVRGSWGEQQLQMTLQHAGFSEGVDYSVQESSAGEDGLRRADFVLNLPKGSKLVIDCKTPFDAYMRAAAALDDGDETAHALHLRDHLDAIRGHIKELSTKAYQNRHPGAECVVMFIPHEGAYVAAVELDNTLTAHGQANQVYVASPSSIVGVLHLSRYILNEQMAREGAQKMLGHCSDLVDRVATLAGHLVKTGNALGRTVENYNNSIKSLDGMLMPTVRKLQTGGVNAGKALPEVPSLEESPIAPRSAEFQGSEPDFPALPFETEPLALAASS